MKAKRLLFSIVLFALGLSRAYAQTVSISGTIYQDGNGLTDGLINGPLFINSAYVNLVDPVSNIILASKLVHGTAIYNFSGLTPNTSYKIVYSWQEVQIGTQHPSNFLAGTSFTGEGTAPNGDGIPDGMTLVSLTTQDVSGVNFGINFLGQADPILSSHINPGGTTQVKVPTLTGSDTEDGAYTGVSGTNTILIALLPTTGTLYYQGVPVKKGDTIRNYVPAQLTVDPEDGQVTVNFGRVTVSFRYHEVDAAGKASYNIYGRDPDPINGGYYSSAGVSMVFELPPPTISGNVFHDGNGLTDNTVNGTPLNDDPPLYVVILDPNPRLGYSAYIKVNKDGTYKITVSSNTTVKLWLYGGTPGFPAYYGIGQIKPVGEHIGSGPGSDGTPDAGIQVTVGQTGNVPEVNFGVDYWPISNNVTAAVQPNSLGTAQVQVPVLTGNDSEDGIYDGISGTNTLRIYTTLNSQPILGILYYDGFAVTNGQTIPNYNPAKLTVDPQDGNVTVRFNYSHVDAAGVESKKSAMVTMPFSSSVSMPVELTRFEGQWLKGQGNLLSWSTAWERDNDRFEIQSSRDAKSFESIGRLTGKGTTAATQTYTFVDAQPLADLTYYRLKQVDTDGQLSYSKIISIRGGLDQMEEQLLIYPNPASDLLRIQAGKQQSVTDVAIYTASGRRVLYQKVFASFVSVTSLPAGVYILEVKTLSGQTLRQRFVKQ